MTDIRVLSLGAGVQSTTLALMACEGTLPGGAIDAAVFADTGWEPARVYAHLERLGAELQRHSIPLHIVSNGNLRRDAVDPGHRFASIPYHTQGEPGPCARCAATGYVVDPDAAPTGLDPVTKPCGRCRGTGWHDGQGLGRRQCTSEYKLAPVRRELRRLLGAAPPDYRRVRRGRVADVLIGFTTDEIERVSNAREVLYERKLHPFVNDLDMTRPDCSRWLRSRGWTTVGKSSCIGCPYHVNAQWRELRDEHPDEWADAVAFDHAIRDGGSNGLPLDGKAYLHRSRVPLELAPIDRVTRAEWRDRQGDLLELAADDEAEEARIGCSPYGCRSGQVAS